MRCATGVRQCEPSILQVIVDSVSGMQGASHSSSSLTSVLRDEAGEKPSLKSICLIPHSGPCSCGERDCGCGGGGGARGLIGLFGLIYHQVTRCLPVK